MRCCHDSRLSLFECVRGSAEVKTLDAMSLVARSLNGCGWKVVEEILKCHRRILIELNPEWVGDYGSD
jgi:hypothetical protein